MDEDFKDEVEGEDQAEDSKDNLQCNCGCNSMKSVPRPQRILVVTYIDVGNTNDTDVETYMGSISSKLVLPNTDTIQWFIPIRNGQSRVEVIYL
jgi:hypothetical protein